MIGILVIGEPFDHSRNGSGQSISYMPDHGNGSPRIATARSLLARRQ